MASLVQTGCFYGTYSHPGSFLPGRFGQFMVLVVLASVGVSFWQIFGASCFGSGLFRPKCTETNKV